MAVAEVDGPGAGLAALDRVAGDRRLASYQPYWAARADLLARADRIDEARQAYDTAIGLQSDPAARAFLAAQRDRLAVVLN